MTAMAVTVTQMLKDLEEEDYMAAIRYIEFLSVTRKRERSKNNKMKMKEIQSLFSDDKGWNSEEDMLADMAEFRRERQNI